MTLAILAAVLVGFSRSFYLHAWYPERPIPPEPFFVLHGIVFTAWFVLLPLQALLISQRRPAMHRAFGSFGVALAVAMVILGVHGAAIAAARAGGFVGVPIPGWQFLIVPIVDMAIFAAFTTLAISRRRDAQAHKRWMLLGSIAILGAAFARWPLIDQSRNPLLFFAAVDVLLIPIVVRDWLTRGRLHPATLWGALVIVLSQPLRLALSGTGAWHASADTLIRLFA
jgi:cytochrome bd-type quinol oxidase subunit 2